jgi:hypothetical protein
MAEINLGGAGYNEVATVTTSGTFSVASSGVVQNVTATSTQTLPATVVGTTAIYRVGKEGITLTIAPNASDNIVGNGFTSVDNKAMIFTNQPAGSYVVLIADGTTAGGWCVSRINGVATRQA